MQGIVFSKDRPLQLDATLRSFALHAHDAATAPLKVLYAASTSRLRSLYRQLMNEHPEVGFIQERDFRADLLLLLRGTEHVLFLVDDAIFVRDFTASAILNALGQHADAVGFSLRLGRNTTYCYSLDRAQPLPEFQTLAYQVLKFCWTDAACDFGYPLELSSSVYRTADLLPLLEQLAFKNPNTLEAQMAGQADRFRAGQPFLLCPEQSWAFCAPVNMVQQVCANRAGGRAEYSPETLARLFAEGQRVEVQTYGDFTPQACHQEVPLNLVRTGPTTPLVSVVIPCYGQAQFLHEAVESVIGQTFTDWEIIVVNDGSPDHTSEIAKGLVSQHPSRSIRLLEKRNGGLADARNAGIRVARGAYILPLDADDQIEPTMLQKTVALLETRPDVAIAYTDVRHFGGVHQVIQASDYDFVVLCDGNQLNYCSLYPREVWEQVGGYNSNMIWGYEDWDFWIGCGERGFVAKRIPEPLLLYRVKESSMYTKALEHDQELRARIVANHPFLYDARRRQQAETMLAGTHFPAPPGAPMVSVIVPTFNRPGMLQETLESILKQTLPDFEIIVVNDGGLDVGHVIRPFDRQQEIAYLKHAQNKGLAAARNTGLRFARGKYIAYLDDDDIFYPQHLDTLVKFAESAHHPVVYSDAYCAKQTKVDGSYVVTERHLPHSHDFDHDRILVANLLPVLCVLHERRCLDKTGCFDEELTTHEDWDMWIRMSRHYPFVHLKEVTCEFRSREDGSSLTTSQRADFSRTAEMIYNKSAPWLRERPSRRTLFNRIYNWRKRRGQEDPPGDLERETLAMLGRGWYAAFWLHRKATNPFAKLKRAARKRLSFR